ncbi:MAG: phosphopantetheine-binding protein [Planctomycetota bacterium]
MAAASRTPEGLPSRCHVCGARVDLDYSRTGGDAPCPRCGALLVRAAQLAVRLEAAVRAQLGLADEVELDALPLRGFGGDSLDVVEAMMELEEGLDDWSFEIDREQLMTFGDLIRAVLAAKQ